jgi:hypothetical protein
MTRRRHGGRASDKCISESLSGNVQSLFDHNEPSGHRRAFPRDDPPAEVAQSQSKRGKPTGKQEKICRQIELAPRQTAAPRIHHSEMSALI